MLFDFSAGPFILMYHSIVDNPNDPFSVTVDAFRKQICWLYQHEFEVISLESLLRSIQARNYRALRKKVVLTFDDGYRDFLTNALPILHDHKATATVFLVTDLLGGKSLWNKSTPDEPLMGEGEVRDIKSQGISLGSHTASHTNLTLMDCEEMKRQLQASLDTLTRLGEFFYTFSYPWGQWSVQIAEIVKATGFACALAVGEQTRLTVADTYSLPRITMRRDMGLKHFQSLMRRSHYEVEIRKKFHTAARTLRFSRLRNTIG